MRRSELLGLRWDDIDLTAGTMSINRGLVAVAYELHESRGKTRNSRRRIDLDPTTVAVLTAWRDWQETERAAVGAESQGWVFTAADRGPGIRATDRSDRFYQPGPVEAPEEDSLNTVEALARHSG